MNEVDVKKEMRYQFLHYLYYKSGGSRAKYLDMWEIVEKLGFSKDETQAVYQYLAGETLI